MPLPKNVSIFKDGSGQNVQHDPYDRVDYLLDLLTEGLLEAGESVASYTLTVRAEAAALGLTLGSAAYAPSQPNGTSIKFWLEVASGNQSDSGWDGDGQILGIECSVTTDNTPARRRQRTVAIQVAQQ